MNRRLSKSRFQKGLQCEKALWLSIHTPELAEPVCESRQWIFDQGTEVGRLAQQRFPDGVEVSEDYLHSAEALDTTARLIAEGTETMYEPAFFFDDVLVRVDVLVAVGDGLWDLYEVKSTSRVKPEHVTDAAVQTYVVEGSGLRVRNSHIVHLDTSYVYEGGEYDLSQLFAIEDVTHEARAFMPAVEATLARFQAMLAGPEPDVRIGQQCSKPYGCDFAAYCYAFLPADHPVTNLPYLSERSLHALLDAGITCIQDIPSSFGGLSSGQRATVQAVKSGDPQVNLDSLAEDLRGLEWPVYHLDFETVNPALPLWPGTRPYEQTPFQYSIHVHHQDGTHEHREYLHVGADDPRTALVQRMLADLDEHGSVTHYTSYERTRLEALARALPEHADGISAVLARLVDLAPFIARNTTHPDAAGRTSIKYVLPAWCPDMSYADLEIGDGQTASVRYLAAITGRLGEDEAEAVYRDLIRYCERDTYAMVRLLDRLRGMVE
jgi:predicted RecB family nuclease